MSTLRSENGLNYHFSGCFFSSSEETLILSCLQIRIAVSKGLIDISMLNHPLPQSALVVLNNLIQKLPKLEQAQQEYQQVMRAMSSPAQKVGLYLNIKFFIPAHSFPVSSNMIAWWGIKSNEFFSDNVCVVEYSQSDFRLSQNV